MQGITRQGNVISIDFDIWQTQEQFAKDRGDKLSLYHIRSSVAPAYDVEKFLLGEKLPACYLIN